MSAVATSLRVREGIRQCILAWIKPNKLALEDSRRKLNQALKSRWALEDTEVYELVYENWNAPAHLDHPNYIVFIDSELDVDWVRDGTLPDDRCELVTEAEAVGARRCKHLPIEQVLEFKRLISHAIVSGIRGSHHSSRKLIQDAALFLRERTIERSRAWTLVSAHLFFLILSFGLLSIFRVKVGTPLSSADGLGLWIGASGGLLGAYLSILQRAGKSEWDAASGIAIHRIEVLTKLLAGMTLGGISFVISRSVHAPPSIAALTTDNYSLFLFGFGGGLIERLIPTMVTRYSETLSQSKQ